jgi:hypothetical protein
MLPTIFEQLVSLLERLESLSEHLGRIQTDVHELKVQVLLEMPEGEDDDTFLLENNSD